MKAHFLTLIAIISTFNIFLTNSVRGQTPVISPNKLAANNLQIKKDIQLNLGAFGRAQQAYFLEYGRFTRNLKNLGMGDNYKLQFPDYRLQILTDKNAKRAIMAVLIPQKPGLKTYISVAQLGFDSSREITTNSKVCESEKNQRLIPKLPKVTINNNYIRCPNKFQEFQLSAEEKTESNQVVKEAELQKYREYLAELEKPQKISALVEADRLAQQGKHLEALKKYRQSLSAIALDYNLLLTELSLDDGNTESYSLLVAVRDALVNKITPLLTAAQPEIDRQFEERDREISNFLAEFPSQANETAAKIRQITTKQLDLDLHFQASPPKSPRGKVFAELSEYFTKFEGKSSAEQINLPENIRAELNQEQPAISAISKLIAANQLPTWDIDNNVIKRGDFQEPLPSFVSYVDLQNMLLADVLNQHQQGNVRRMEASLEASWKLSESMQNQPLLITQLVNIMVRRRQMQVMRKIENLPIGWQEKLLAINFHQSLMKGLQSEAIYRFTSINRDANFPNTFTAAKLLRRWEAVDFYRATREVYKSIEEQQENICNLDIGTFADKLFAQKDFPDSSFSSSLISQLNKANSLMLEAEMTQQILQIKANKNKIVAGETKSQICNGSKWQYKQLANGKWSISLDRAPIWQSQQTHVRLSYTGNSRRNPLGASR